MSPFLKILITILIAFSIGALLAVGYPLHFALGALLMLIVLYVFIINPLQFLFFLFLLRPILDNFLTSIRTGGGGSSWGMGGLLSLFLTVGTFFTFLFSAQNVRKFQIPFIGRIYIVFFFFGILSFVISPDKVEAFKVLLRVSSIFAIFMLTIFVCSDYKKVLYLVRAILLSAILPIIFGFYIYSKNGGRFQATFGHPNILAFYLLIIIGCLLFKLDKTDNEISLFRFSLIAFLSGVLILTQTRSSWFAFFLMMTIYVFRFKRTLIPAFIGLSLALCFTPLVQTKIANIFSSYGGKVSVNEESSLGWRLQTWKGLFKEGLNSPLWGHGLESTHFYVKENLQAHNDYLRYFFEEGLIGLILYFLPFIYLFLHALRRYKTYQENGQLQKLAGFIICFIPAFLLMSFSENLAAYIIIQWYLWALFGMYCSLLQKDAFSDLKKI